MIRSTRRRFLRTCRDAATVGAAALVLRGGGRLARAAPNPLVYSATHANMVVGGDNTVQYEWVKAGVDACVRAMTGAGDAAAAWQAIFPGITSASRIAIKVNCLNTNVHPQFETVRAIVEGLTSMFGATFPAGNIALFDNNLWTTGKVNACYGAAALDALGIGHDEDAYESGQTVAVGGTTLYVSRLWATADYGISLAKMSPHQYYAGGLSGVIKNMMGAVSTQPGATYGGHDGANGFHDAAPYAAFRDLFQGYAAAHLHLHVVDMLFACRHENESGWARVVRRLTMGQDPCAVDAYNADALSALGMNVVRPVTKEVPLALESAGVGTTGYTLVEPAVSLNPNAPDRDDLEALVRDARAGTATEAEVRQAIKAYRLQ